jgi:hypothetical protein
MVLAASILRDSESFHRSRKAAVGRTYVAFPTAAIFFVGAAASPAFAQNDRNAWVLDLPRPGYEPRQIQAGPATIDASLSVDADYNSNIFATPTDEEGDVIVQFRPHVSAEAPWRNTVLNAVAYADLRRFTDNTQENVNTFGANLTASLNPSRAQSASAKVSYDRTFERRDDPDANSAATDPLTTIDNLGAEVRYNYRPGRFGVSTGVGVTNANYRRDEDDDRDLTTYRVSARGLVGVSSNVDVFVEGYTAIRDARLAVDRNGINRDSTTYGAFAGVALDLTEKLDGEIGAGVFRAALKDPTLEDFTGLGVSGNLRWSPRPRTGVTLSVFRGDVATIRNGASGRIDFRARAEVIQEIRHNVRARAGVGYRNGRFRTVNPQIEKDVSARIGGEYLLNRHVVLNAEYEFRNRNSTLATDDFNAHIVGVSLTLQY